MDFAILEALEPEPRRRLLASARRRRFARDEVVFHAGDPADGLLLLASGRVTVRAVAISPP